MNLLAANGKEVSRRDHSQVGIPRNLDRSPARALGEIALGQRLQTPGNPPEEMLPVSALCFFMKHLPKLLAQTR